MIAIIITSIICATWIISLYLLRIYPKNIRKYKIIAAKYKAEFDELKKDYNARLDGYTDWFEDMEQRLSELVNIAYDKINNE